MAMCRGWPGAVGADGESSWISAFSSLREASSNCPDAAFTRSVNASAHRGRSNPLRAAKIPDALDRIPAGTVSDDSHCLVFSVRS